MLRIIENLPCDAFFMLTLPVKSSAQNNLAKFIYHVIVFEHLKIFKGFFIFLKYQEVSRYGSRCASVIYNE